MPIITRGIKDGTVTAEKLADGAVEAAAIGDGEVTGAKLATGILKVSLLDGQDGDPATYTLTGAASGDEVVFVGHISTKAAIATLADVTSDFTITGAAELTDGGATDYSNDQLQVIWIDHT